MKSLFDLEKELFLPTYSRIPVEISHGQGIYLFDTQGKKYMDFFAGLAVNALGYAHPGIVKAVCEQISKFGHLSNSFITDIQIRFAEKLIKYSGMDRIFLSNSGTEAIEGVIKLIRMAKGSDKKIFALSDSFHGRTYGALSLTMRDKYRKGFEPLLPNIELIKHNSADDLDLKVNGNTAAIFLEFIQGEGGINEISHEFIDKLVALKKKYDFIFVADAIQDGIGRTGKAFAHEYYNVKPDVIVVAKAIGGGLPLGAFLTNQKSAGIFSVGKHGTTFGGNPVACAAGIVVLEEIFEKGLLQAVKTNGLYFKQSLEELKSEFPYHIKEIRGKGYMLGIELYYEGADLVRKIREKGILINCTNLNVLRILPPLIAEKTDIEFFINTLRNLLKEK